MKLPRHIVKELRAILGQDNLLTDPAELAVYSRDASNHEGMPDAVVLPQTHEEAARVVLLAASHAIPITPRGAGSGVCGGSVAVRGGLTVSLARMNRITGIDQDNHTARVEPGVINADLKAEAAACGLYYPPDPASFRFCTIGGNVATGAGGPSAVKYGVTRDYVRAITAVLPDGSTLEAGTETAKGVAGYDLCRLLVGSEGTLALFTGLTLALVPLPRARATLLVFARSATAAASLVAPLLEQVVPCALEFMDPTAARLVAEKLPRPPAADESLLLVELDGDPETVAIEEKRLSVFLKDRAGVTELFRAADEDEAERLRAARRSLSPASFYLNPDKINEDVVVPRKKIPDLVRFVHDLGRDLAIPVFTFGHAGDGNLHVNIMIDRSDPRQKEAGAEARKKLFRRVMEMDGTITGEHGIGLSKMEFLPEEAGPRATGLMAAIKKVFDPAGIMNPGKVLE